jgi:hypothetical protein
MLPCHSTEYSSSYANSAYLSRAAPTALCVLVLTTNCCIFTSCVSSCVLRLAKGKGKAKAKAPVIRGANGRIKRKCSTKPVKYTVDSEEEESEYNDSDEVYTAYVLLLHYN